VVQQQEGLPFLPSLLFKSSTVLTTKETSDVHLEQVTLHLKELDKICTSYCSNTEAPQLEKKQ
jgi:hypothetical protein